MTNLSPVVVGYDFSRSGHAALRRAVTLATRAPYHVLHVLCVVLPHEEVPSIASDGLIDHRYMERVQETLAGTVHEELELAHPQHRIHFFIHARLGKPADELLSLAREVNADLIVVGSHSLHGLERLLVGSVSERVVRDAQCSVEVAREKTYAETERIVRVHDEDYVAPHRYEYEDHNVVLRPAEWPLY